MTGPVLTRRRRRPWLVPYSEYYQLGVGSYLVAPAFVRALPGVSASYFTGHWVLFLAYGTSFSAFYISSAFLPPRGTPSPLVTRAGDVSNCTSRLYIYIYLSNQSWWQQGLRYEDQPFRALPNKQKHNTHNRARVPRREAKT